MLANQIGKKRIKNIFSFSKKISQNNNGQFAIETVLLMAVLVGGFVLFTNQVKQSGYITKLFSAPILNIKNMTSYGTWKESCTGFGSSKSQQTLANCHPNSITRGLSSNPNL